MRGSFIAGPLSQKWNFWKSLTYDPHVLDAIQRYRLELTDVVVQQIFMGNIRDPSVIWLEVQKLLKLGVVKEVLPVAGQIVSPVFLVPKKDGSQRMISNLRRLNQYIDYEHFKISSVSEARMLVQRGSSTLIKFAIF